MSGVAQAGLIDFGGAAQAVDPNGLVAHWSMNGSAVDAGPHSLDGTLVGDATFAPGIHGDSVTLDGDGDYVNIEDPLGTLPTALGGLSEGTISV